MTLSVDDEMAAAEFALGTLDADERATLAARRLREPELDQAIRAWEQRLAPLTEAVPGIEPPPGAYGAIEARIRSASPRPAQVQDGAEWSALRRSRALWRFAALAASLVAALLAIGFFVGEVTQKATPRQYVAILQKDAASPAFEVTVDLNRQDFSVRPIAAEAPAGKAFQLWMIEPRLGKPRSLGVIGAGRSAAALAVDDQMVIQDATYAVTVEPPGGSPTGQPTSAPVFVGKLIPVGP